MKKSLFALLISAFCVTMVHAEEKKICHDKNGKPVCKVIKIHAKLDGTKVPEKKK